MAFRAHRLTSSGAAASSLSAGGGKRRAVASTWAALATTTDSDDSASDCETETTHPMVATLAAFRAAAARLASREVPAMLEDNPTLVALHCGDLAWGDILCDVAPPDAITDCP